MEEQLRESINTPNQSMSSDINLQVFADLDAAGVEVLFPMHDAIYAQAPEGRVSVIIKTIKSTMESVLDSPVPFRADVKCGPNWAQIG